MKGVLSMICKNCGANVGKEYRLCPYCMSELEYPENKAEQQPIIIQNIINNQPNVATSAPPTVSHHQLCSPKDKSMTLILCVVLGMLGAHCFYAGKAGMGILYLFTGGLFGIGWIVDIIRIAAGSYTDSHGLPIK